MFLILAQTPSPSPIDTQAASFDWFEPLSLLIGVLVGGVITYGVNLLTQRKMEQRQSAKRRKYRIYTPLRQELIKLLEWRQGTEKGRAFSPIYTKPFLGPIRPDPAYWFLLWNEMSVDGRARVSSSESVRQAMLDVLEAINLFNDQLAEARGVIKQKAQGAYEEMGGRLSQLEWDELLPDLIEGRLRVPKFPYTNPEDLTESESQRLGNEFTQRLLGDQKIKAAASKLLDADDRLKGSAHKGVQVLEDAMQHISRRYEHERITE